jgi:glycosyltransferase involved in cell wall biosynthesis
LFDAFVSNFDTLCNDRKVFSKDSILGKGAFWLDKSALQLSATTLLDTHSHAVFFSKTFDLPLSNFQVLPVGCNDEIFYPMAKKTPSQNTQVLYYSSFLPLHGSDVIVRAAALLREKPIQFKLIGDGPDFANVIQMAKSFGLNNITFAPPVPLRRLAIEIAESDICLGGHFGKSDKAKRVIPGKIYQMLAGGRPIIATNYPGNRELLSHGDTAFLIEKPTPELLADAIDLLHSDPASRFELGRKARILYESQCSEAVIGQKLIRIVNETLLS